MTASIIDPVVQAINDALRAILWARIQANGDTRTNGTQCTDFLDRAVEATEQAKVWFREYLNEERHNQKQAPPPKVKPQEPDSCALCEDDIAPGDTTICSGCNKTICSACMGENEVCKSCEASTD